jgi:hypothetical protein
MPTHRRDWLSFAGRALLAPLIGPLRANDSEQQRRVAEMIREYERQGGHRTGTPADRISGEWLMAEVRRTGLKPARETFTISRIDPAAGYLTVAGRKLEGLPLFDGGLTDAEGVPGRLGALGSDAPIGLIDLVPNAGGAGELLEARRQNRHKAIVAVTRGGRPGLCPSNADSFLHPFGPPVLQVSSEQGPFLLEQAQQKAEVALRAVATRSTQEAFNVTAAARGSNRALPPLVIMTPRSGWWSCASERGGGIACWLELMRTFRAAQPVRDVVFVASTGHEIGYLGIETFVSRRPGVVKEAHAWIHLGANIGAAQSPSNAVQASDDDMEKRLTDAMAKAELRVDRRVPRGSIPGGEAGVVHRGGGRYVSVIGGNALFHNPADQGPDAIDPVAISRFARAFAVVAQELAA